MSFLRSAGTLKLSRKARRQFSRVCLPWEEKKKAKEKTCDHIATIYRTLSNAKREFPSHHRVAKGSLSPHLKDILQKILSPFQFQHTNRGREPAVRKHLSTFESETLKLFLASRERPSRNERSWPRFLSKFCHTIRFRSPLREVKNFKNCRSGITAKQALTSSKGRYSDITRAKESSTRPRRSIGENEK